MNSIVKTADGSFTLFNEEIGEHYHSQHGALQESKHVFIDAGLKFKAAEAQKISILEIGFGTGLNFLLSFDYAQKNDLALNYVGIEAFPLPQATLIQTEYQNFISQNTWDLFIENYTQAQTASVALNDLCNLKIEVTQLHNYTNENLFDLIYYDAFSVQHQPEMWTDEIIAHTASFLKKGGVFVTYAITGKLKRALKSCGFEIQKLPGAPGKREMLRAIKS